MVETYMNVLLPYTERNDMRKLLRKVNPADSPKYKPLENRYFGISVSQYKQLVLKQENPRHFQGILSDIKVQFSHEFLYQNKYFSLSQCLFTMNM